MATCTQGNHSPVLWDATDKRYADRVKAVYLLGKG
ncbi:hypothetical protein SAMN05428977_10897 [Nitrosomonas sp. Nm166]|nr:hypothetical protein SAMN05428977_10897 [Nitrosomonas sp. Nm166]